VNRLNHNVEVTLFGQFGSPRPHPLLIYPLQDGRGVYLPEFELDQIHRKICEEHTSGSDFFPEDSDGGSALPFPYIVNDQLFIKEIDVVKAYGNPPLPSHLLSSFWNGSYQI
jgi:hypothetical protein